MNRFLKTFITSVLLLFCIVPAFSQAEVQVEMPLKLKDFVENLESKKSELQGGAIAILYKGQVVYKTTFGYQRGNEKPITESTLFPLASVSKAVSAIAVGLMVDQGHLNFDEKFKIPCLKYPVSLADILSHTTGYQFSGNAQIEQGMNRTQLLHTLKAQQPNCKPGKCYRYSNAIFSLVEEALNFKKLSLDSVISNLCSKPQVKGIKPLKEKTNEELAYPHSKKTVNGKDIIKPLPFPPYYPKTTPASAGIFASIDGMIEFFKLSFGILFLRRF